MSESHRFTANKVVVEKAPLVLALGDVDLDDVPRQSLLIMRDDEGPHWLCLQLNDQGNTCGEKGIESVDLGDAELRIALRGKILRAGDCGDPAGEPVSELLVAFSLLDPALKELRDGCAATFRGACAFHYVGCRLA